METRFLADAMLGKLAKWLRVMGHDTHYEPFYREGTLEPLILEGRTLLSRHRATVDEYPNAVLILSDHVKDQLRQLHAHENLSIEKDKWFSRCLICNVPLGEAKVEDARENVPEYVFYQNKAEIRVCPSCGRYFWPGSHREKMVKQLEAWGF